MTRGKFYFIDNDTAISSTEFNGDMYREGHGDTALAALRYDVTTKEDFIQFAAEFNEVNFQYDEEWAAIRDVSERIFDNEDKTLIDFTNDYFGRFFSDYIFIKNESDRDITIIDKDNQKQFTIESGKTMRLNFGHVNNTTFKYDEDFDFENRRKYLADKKA
jgi:hypothetical protein